MRFKIYKDINIDFFKAESNLKTIFVYKATRTYRMFYQKSHVCVFSSDPFKNKQAKPKYHFEDLPVFAEKI